MAQKPGKVVIAPLKWDDEVEHRRKLALAVNNALDRKINAVITVTLETEMLSTTIVDDRIIPTTSLALAPLTPSAQAMVGAGLSIVPTVGSATLYHRQTAIPDLTYKVSFLG